MISSIVLGLARPVTFAELVKFCCPVDSELGAGTDMDELKLGVDTVLDTEFKLAPLVTFLFFKGTVDSGIAEVADTEVETVALALAA